MPHVIAPRLATRGPRQSSGCRQVGRSTKAFITDLIISDLARVWPTGGSGAGEGERSGGVEPGLPDSRDGRGECRRDEATQYRAVALEVAVTFLHSAHHHLREVAQPQVDVRSGQPGGQFIVRDGGVEVRIQISALIVSDIPEVLIR